MVNCTRKCRTHGDECQISFVRNCLFGELENISCLKSGPISSPSAAVTWLKCGYPHQRGDHDDSGFEKASVSQSASKCTSGQPEEKKPAEYYQVKGDDHHDHDHHKYCDHYDDDDDKHSLVIAKLKY